VKKYDHLIIGAGLTGIELARLLRAKGQSVILLEKSRGLGGRISTRRIDNEGFDHGALYLDEAISELNRTLISTPLGYYRESGMNQLMKDLAQGLLIERDHKVSELKKNAEGWTVICENGSRFEATQVTLTAPVPQVLELLKQNNLIQNHHSLFEVQYSKALLLLIVVKHLPLGTYSQLWEGHEITLMDERSLHSQGIIFRLSSALSEEYFELPDDEIIQKIMSLWHHSPMSKLEMEKWELKKWRYCRPLGQYHHSFEEIQPGLFLAGDGFEYPLRSARDLANQL
jgi:renalase